jgi:hypothetical protein
LFVAPKSATNFDGSLRMTGFLLFLQWIEEMEIAGGVLRIRTFFSVRTARSRTGQPESSCNPGLKIETRGSHFLSDETPG